TFEVRLATAGAEDNLAMTLSGAGQLTLDLGLTDGGGSVLTSPAINGTIATTGLTMPAFTLGGNITAGNYSITGLSNLEGRTDSGFNLTAKAAANILYLAAERTFANTGIAIVVRTFGANDVVRNRLTITGGVNDCVATWANTLHTGLKLGGALNANGQNITGCGYVGLKVTDTDGAVEGYLWFDASENKLKFYDGAAVQTVTST
ncbi:hypothetical protein LCGC14_3019340, partial [marine sediment metagenome]